MNEIKHWFESENEEIFVKSAIDDKNRAMTELGNRIYKRKNDWTQLEISIPNFQSALTGHINKAQEEYNKQQSKKACTLNEENLQDINKIIQNYQDTLNNSMQKLAKPIKFIDSPVSWEALNRHLKEMNDVSIFCNSQKINKIYTDAERRVKEELKKLEKEKKEKKEKEEKEKKEKEEKEKKEKEAANSTSQPKETKPENDSTMQVD